VCRIGETLRLAIAVKAADGDGGAGNVFGAPRALVQHDRSARRLRRHGANLRAGVLGKQRDSGAGRR
jgi:hypothetical protein